MAGPTPGLAVPSLLRDLPGWLCWRYERIEGSGKAIKVPYYANGGRRYGRQGDARDRASLVPLERALERAKARGMDGVGLAMLADWGVTALDFDACVDTHGHLPAELEALVCDTYAEYSPSGKGVRAFVKGALGDRKSRAIADRYGVETFTASGFVTVTGNPLYTVDLFDTGDVVAPVSTKLRAFCDARFGPQGPGPSDPDDFMVGHEPTLGLSEDEIRALLADLDPSMGRDDWIRVGMALHHETEGDGFDLWDEWSSDGEQYPGSDQLQAQWDSFTRRQATGRQVTMASVIKMAREAREAQNPSERLEKLAEKVQVAEPSASYATPPGYPGRFPFVAASDYMMREPPEWIIKGVLPRADLGVLYGASGSGKSFAVLDMALAVARGADWRERPVKQGAVLYVAAEGGGGVASRVKAYAIDKGLSLDGVPLGIMNAVPNFLIEEDITAVVEAMAAAGPTDLVVVDTFAQVTPGANENSGEDMGLALRHARAIRDATGAMVLLVHHSGKDAARGARGWSGIRAAADVEFEVMRPDEGQVRVLRVSKQKDGRDDLSWGFTLEPVVVGLDRDGEEMSSLVVRDATVPVAQKPTAKRRLGAWEQVVMDAIGLLEPSVTSMSLDKLLDYVVGTVPAPEEGARDIRRQSVMRAVRSLQKGEDAPLMLEHGVVQFCA